jgi:hypothetical protein
MAQRSRDKFDCRIEDIRGSGDLMTLLFGCLGVLEVSTWEYLVR